LIWEIAMDWTQVEGNWKQIKGRVKERWGKLTNDDLTAIAGRRDRLEGMIQERYGYASARVRNEIEDWQRSLESGLEEQIASLRSGIRTLSSAVERIADEQLTHTRSTAEKALNDVEEAFRRNPLVVIAVALGLGFLIGMLTRR
jgi:uncharacterized protein YjbJ (UPF0337 family)